MSFWDLVFGVATAVAIATVVFAVISYEAIVDWFREKLGNSNTNKNLLAVTVMQKLQAGSYEVVQGIFNASTEQYESQRVVKASQVDQDFLAAHDKNGNAVWTV